MALQRDVTCSDKSGPLSNLETSSDGEVDGSKVRVKRPQNGINQVLQAEQEDGEIDGKQDLDSRYAWLILIIMFLLNSTLSGASRVYGVVYAKQVETNYYNREEASWPIATSSTIENLFGILTPALAQFLSWRQIELLSTSIFVLSNLLAYFSSSLTLDIISLGIIQGIGLSMNTIIIMALNNDYFEKYRTTAYGVALSGSTFGLLYMNPLVTWILSKDLNGDTFRNVYLAIACVCLFNYPLIALIVPRSKRNPEQLERKKGESLVCSLNNNDNNDLENKENQAFHRKISSCLNNYLARNNSFAFFDLNKYNREELSNWRRNHTVSNFARGSISADPAYGAQRSRSANKLERSGTEIGKARLTHSMVVLEPAHLSHLPVFEPKRCDTSESKLPARTLIKVSSDGPKMEILRKNAVASMQPLEDNAATATNRAMSYGEQVDRVPKKSVVSFHIDLESNHSIGENDVYYQPNQSNLRENSSQLMQNNNATILDSQNEDEDEDSLSIRLILKLLKMPCLHCVWMMLTIYYLLSRVFIMIIVDFGKDRNLEPNESSGLLNYWSIGEICGRIILASLIDLSWLSVKNCIIITCSTLSLSIFSLVLASDYSVGFYFYAFSLSTIAALISLEYVLINVFLLDYIKLSKSSSSNYIQITSCYSIGSLISSLLLVARPTLIGLYRDRLGSYDGLLLLLAALPLLFALLFALIEPAMRPKPSYS